jgi:acetylornithine deacetylase/succinyl-diaminopimelate desuccinylase-like protein
MSAHPGNWECELRAADRTVFRTIRFVVTAEGVAPHAEETAGLSLPEGVHLVDAVIPSEGPLDERTDPALARAGAFYGRAWATDAGRAAHASIPARGEAYPPSARRSAASTRRR